MAQVKVDLKDHGYDIVIGHQIFEGLGTALKALKAGQDAVVVTHPVIRRAHGRALTEGLRRGGLSVKILEVPEGEASKSAAQAMALLETIAALDVKKQIVIVAFGGGVIGDLAGFVAAVYKRGIPFVQVPTTLLAQVDSAIGGKVAIDLPIGKNLVGAFYQPRLVYSDTAALATLDTRQIRNGLAEVIKYGVICDKALFDYVETHARKLLAKDPRALTEVVTRCSRIKARVVAGDEKETRGMRTILNFGHTVGHAIEAANQFRDYQHGEAVALGMRAAAHISLQMDLIDAPSVERLRQVISAVGLPERLEHVDLKAVLKHMEHDKKFQAAKNKFVLATGIGHVKVVEGVARPVIEKAVKALF